jgi:hypothetical protein
VPFAGEATTGAARPLSKASDATVPNKSDTKTFLLSLNIFFRFS